MDEQLAQHLWDKLEWLTQMGRIIGYMIQDSEPEHWATGTGKLRLYFFEQINDLFL